MSTTELRRAYKFRLYPTEAQEAELAEWERQLRWLYNLAHEQRLASLARPKGERPGDHAMRRGHDLRDRAAPPARAWIAALGRGDVAAARPELRCARALLRAAKDEFRAGSRQRITYFRQAREMTELLAVDDQLARVVCCARQEVLRDLEKAWQKFFARKGGRPRFKRRTDSVHLYFSSPKDWKLELGKLSFSGMAASVGAIKMDQDQPWPGDSLPSRLTTARKAKLAKRPRRTAPKFSACHITRDVDQWLAVFTLAFSEDTPKPRGGAVGINRGAIHAIADSTGRVVDSPRYYARALATIRRRSGDLERKDPRRKPRPTRLRVLRKDPDGARATAALLGITLTHLRYQVEKRGGMEPAIAWMKAHPQTPKGPTAPRRPTVYLGRNRFQARTRLAIAHRLVRRQRRWWLHDQSAHYASSYKVIGIEKFATKKMVGDPKAEETYHFSTTCKRHGCDDKVVKHRLCQRHYDEQRSIPKRAVHRSILDVGWYELGRQLTYKTEARGGRVAVVQAGLQDSEAFDDPARGGISKTCGRCGAPLAESASGHRTAFCDACGLVELGDVNAAVNVLRRALRQKPPKPTGRPRASAQIKGRVKRSLAPEKPSDEA